MKMVILCFLRPFPEFLYVHFRVYFRTLAPIPFCRCCLASPMKDFSPCHQSMPQLPRLVTSVMMSFHFASFSKHSGPRSLTTQGVEPNSIKATTLRAHTHQHASRRQQRDVEQRKHTIHFSHLGPLQHRAGFGGESGLVGESCSSYIQNWASRSDRCTGRKLSYANPSGPFDA
jgi:hypothetical protein